MRLTGGAIILLVSALLAPAATFYVAPGGSDTNSGSQLKPFRQIQKAAAVVHPGDTVLVADGVYLGFDVNSKVATSNAPITIRALGTNAVVTTTTNRSDNRDTIYIAYSAWVIVDGLRAFNANRAAVRVDNSPHVTIRNGVFGNNSYWGIFTDFADDLLLEKNECFGSTNQHGIYVSNSGDRPIVRGNRVHDNYGSGIQLNADASQGGDGIISGAVIEDNIIFNNGAGGGGALNLDGVQDSIVRNNLLFTNHSSGIICFQIDGAAGPRGMQILNNTVDMAANGRWALSFVDTSGTNYARNNILYNRHSFHGGLRMATATDAQNTDSDYNVMDRITDNDDASRYTLAQWQALGHELHSWSLPLTNMFVNWMQTNYHLLASSAAVDRGLSLTNVPRDMEWNARPQRRGFDIGCFELPPPRITISRASDVVTLRLGPEEALNYRLEVSTNLWTWALATNFFASNSVWIYGEPTAASPYRFFRARSF